MAWHQVRIIMAILCFCSFWPQWILIQFRVCSCLSSHSLIPGFYQTYYPWFDRYRWSRHLHAPNLIISSILEYLEHTVADGLYFYSRIYLFNWVFLHASRCDVVINWVYLANTYRFLPHWQYSFISPGIDVRVLRIMQINLFSFSILVWISAHFNGCYCFWKDAWKANDGVNFQAICFFFIFSNYIGSACPPA